MQCSKRYCAKVALGWLSGANHGKPHRCRRRSIRSHHCGTALGRPNTSVLLMEAGPDYENKNTTPADLLDSKNLAGPAHDWGYKAIPVEGRIIPYQRGKVVGGTSAINAAGALWPRPADFHAWV